MVILLAIPSFILGMTLSLKAWTIRVYVLKAVILYQTDTNHLVYLSSPEPPPSRLGGCPRRSSWTRSLPVRMSIRIYNLKGLSPFFSYLGHTLFSFTNWFPQNRHDSEQIHPWCHPDRPLRWDLFRRQFNHIYCSPGHELLRHVRYSHGANLHECE